MALHLVILVCGFALAGIALVQVRRTLGRRRVGLTILFVIGLLIALAELINIVVS